MSHRRISFFEVTGVPADAAAANKAAWDSVVPFNIHIEQPGTGRRFLVQVTDVNPIGFESIRALDVENQIDAKTMLDLMPTVQKAIDGHD